MKCQRLAESPSSSPPPHISVVISSPLPPTHPLFLPTAPYSFTVMDDMSPLSFFLSSVSYGAKVMCGSQGWVVTAGKLQILGYCVLSFKYDVVSVSKGCIASPFSVLHVHSSQGGLNLWCEYDG